MVGPAWHAALGSTSLLTAVLSAAHVPSTATRLLLARIKPTANATQATQVKMNIRDTYSKQHLATTHAQHPNTNTNINLHNAHATIKTSHKPSHRCRWRDLLGMQRWEVQAC